MGLVATLPDDPAKRKGAPVFTGVMKYFPRAMCEIAKVSVAGQKQHNPGQPLGWDRSKSTDDLDAAARHMLDAGGIDSDGQRHTAKAAWRLMAALERELEAAASASRQNMTASSLDIDALYRQADRSP